LRVEARIAPSKKIQKLRDECGLTKEIIKGSLVNDPLLLFRKPINKDETLIKICMKLYQQTSAEAVRVTSSSIYYGRVSASVSANAFQISGKIGPLKTFRDCVADLLIEDMGSMDERSFDILYPFRHDYEIMTALQGEEPVLELRSALETVNVRKLYFTMTSAKLYNPVPKVIESIWVEKDYSDNKVLRDWSMIQKINPYMRTTLEETLQQFNGDIFEKVSGLILTLVKLYAIGDKSMKAFIHGPGSWDPKDTFEIVNSMNKYQGLTTRLPLKAFDKNRSSYNLDKIFWFYNYSMASAMTDNHSNIFKMKDHLRIDDEELILSIADPVLSNHMVKRLAMLNLYLGIDRNHEYWTVRTDSVLHKWVKRQQRDLKGNWYGPFILQLTYSNHTSVLEGDDIGLVFRTNQTDPECLFKIIDRACELVQLEKNQLRRKLGPGPWNIIDDKILNVSLEGGFRIFTQQNLGPISYSVDELTVDDEKIQILSSGAPIFTSKPGFLRCNLNPIIPQELDFHFRGLQYSSIVKIGAFRENFDLQDISRKSLLQELDNIIVDEPTISEYTKSRLEITDLKSYIDELDTAEVDYLRNIKKMSHEELMKGFMDADISDFKMPDDDDFSSLFTNQELEGLLSSVIVKDVVIKSWAMWNRIRYLKHHIIGHLMCHVHMLNKRTFDFIKKNFPSPYIIWSIAKCYDTYIKDAVTTSPKGLKLDVDSDFEEMFL
jgi:hypothetical protein